MSGTLQNVCNNHLLSYEPAKAEHFALVTKSSNRQGVTRTFHIIIGHDCNRHQQPNRRRWLDIGHNLLELCNVPFHSR